MTDVAQRPARRPRSCRGGNRLPPERYPAKGPSYERRRTFGPDPERRDSYARTRMRQAVDLALARGELRPILAFLLGLLLDYCNDSLRRPGPDGGPLCSGWWSEKYIHALVYAAAHLSDEGELLELAPDDHTGERTAGRWMADLRELQWMEAVHRQKIINGRPSGTSNLWRLRMPDHLRAELLGREDAGRARKAGRHPKGRPTPKAPQNRTQESSSAGAAAAAHQAVVEPQRRKEAPCAACDGLRFVETPEGLVRCVTCDGSGRARDGP